MNTLLTRMHDIDCKVIAIEQIQIAISNIENMQGKEMTVTDIKRLLDSTKREFIEQRNKL